MKWWRSPGNATNAGRGLRPRPRRLGIERLEDRLVMSWAGIPPVIITPPSSATAVTLNSQGDAQGTEIISANEVDYYRFAAPVSGGYRLAASTPSSDLDTVLGVFDGQGRRLAYNDDISSTNLDSQLTLNLTAGQQYYFGVTNYWGTAGGSYSWLVDGPSGQPGPAPRDDDNDSLAQAFDVGTPTAYRTLTGLVMADGQDWFKFSTSNAGTSSSYVRIRFTNSRGDLDLRLYDSGGALLRSAETSADVERISLSGLAAGTYYAQAMGRQGAANPNYAFDVNPPAAPTATDGRKILYLNFDGSSISNADLYRWAGSDWSSSVAEIDPDYNGINVQPFLSSRGDREQIISRMLNLVQADVQPFGITVRRSTGLAVENQGATTIFLGANSIPDSIPHIACDIDVGNNNRTDVAFVRNEDWGDVETTAVAMTDVVIHEAGHTYGLFHVNSGTALETMGLRYNTSQDFWAQNTSYLNQTFQLRESYGTQNSYQVMAATFGVTSNAQHSSNLRTAAVAHLFDLHCGEDELFEHEHIGGGPSFQAAVAVSIPEAVDNADRGAPQGARADDAPALVRAAFQPQQLRPISNRTLWPSVEDFSFELPATQPDAHPLDEAADLLPPASIEFARESI